MYKHGLLQEFGRGTKNCTFLERSNQSIKHFLLEFIQIDLQNSIEVFWKQFSMIILSLETFLSKKVSWDKKLFG